MAFIGIQPGTAIVGELVGDTTPQLGGDLDVNGNGLVSVSNGNIAITPNGSGLVRLDSNVDIQSGEIVLKNSGSVSNIKFYCESSNAHYTQLQSAAHSAYSGNVTLTLPASTDTLLGRATTDTLTNKTLTSPKINENVAVTATATELNLLDGVTSTTAELNYTDGVTSAIQTQLDSKVGANYTGDVNITGELLVDSYNETFKKVSSVSSVSYYQIASASHTRELSVSSQEPSPNDLAFNSDGTKMFVIGYNDDEVNEYALSTGFNLSTASFTRSFSVSSQDTQPEGLTFNNDGTKMFVLGNEGTDVNEYALSTGFNISTASYTRNFSVSSQEAAPEGITFNNDGTKMFIVGRTDDEVNEYALSTGFNISTASYTRNFSVASQELTPTGLDFNSDGTKMFVIGRTNDSVYEYTLTTGFNISTASYTRNFSIAAKETFPTGIRFSSNGGKMFIIGHSSVKVHEYSTSVTAHSTTFDCENANVFETVLSANTTVVFSNPPAAGTATDSTAYAMSLKVIQDSGASGYTVTWPTSVDWPAATAPTLTATANAVDQFVFYTYDGGANWYGFTAGQALG